MKPSIPPVATATTGQAATRAASIAACRAMESALVAALESAGERLRGLPELGPRAALFRGLRIRGTSDRPLDIPVNAAGHPRLCVDDRGRLVMACVVRRGQDFAIQWRAAEDADLLAEDAQDMAAVLEEAVGDHLAAVERQRERYAGLRRVAEAVTAGLALRKGQ